MPESQASPPLTREERRKRNLQKVKQLRGEVRRARGVLSIPLPGDTRIALKLFAEKERKERHRRASMIDPLTGLVTRNFFDKELSMEIRRKSREPHEVGVLRADMRSLKEFNDRHGHSAGDRALQEIGAGIGESKRDIDTLARYGGDEFAGVFPVLHTQNHVLRSPKEALAIAGLRMLRNIHTKSVPLGDRNESVHLDIGLTLATEADNEVSVNDRADRASYIAKRSFAKGEDKVVVASLASGREVYEEAFLDTQGNPQFKIIENASDILRELQPKRALKVLA